MRALCHENLVTPEMVEAGARILEDVFDASPSSAKSFAKNIFEAMVAAAEWSVGDDEARERIGRGEEIGNAG